MSCKKGTQTLMEQEVCRIGLKVLKETSHLSINSNKDTMTGYNLMAVTVTTADKKGKYQQLYLYK